VAAPIAIAAAAIRKSTKRLSFGAIRNSPRSGGAPVASTWAACPSPITRLQFPAHPDGCVKTARRTGWIHEICNSLNQLSSRVGAHPCTFATIDLLTRTLTLPWSPPGRVTAGRDFRLNNLIKGEGFDADTGRHSAEHLGLFKVDHCQAPGIVVGDQQDASVRVKRHVHRSPAEL
jgi:hypothetical protein